MIRFLVSAALALALWGCTSQSPSAPVLSPLAQKGRTVYVTQCAACHNPSDPTKPGSLGPEIAGSSKELIRARLFDASYPPGYTPKRATKQMQKLPHLVGDVDALHEFLNSNR